MKSINIQELNNFESLDNVIDVREVDEYRAGHIDGVKNIPMMGLMLNPDNFINKEETYYIMCQAGGRSMQVCNVLEEMNYNVVNLAGGYGSYHSPE